MIPQPAVVLSPHLDDAVLSCWHLLDGPGEVTVVNVFTGSPRAGTPTPPWDRATGARDPVSRMRERREEDRQALRVVGRRAVGLGLLDQQYRRSPVQPARLAELLDGHVPPGAVVHAPAGLSGHPDHVAVRAAAMQLARLGRPLVLYADLPHGTTRGWPAWVSGTPEADGLDVGAEWERVLDDAGLLVPRLVPRVRAVDERARERKLRALGEYRTQRPGLDAMSFVPLDDPRALAFEVAWQVPPSALRGADEARGQLGVADTVGQALHHRR